MNLYKILISSFLLINVLNANGNIYDKYLSSENKAIVYSDLLYERGMLDEGIAFSKIATSKFPNSEKLLFNYAATLFELKKNRRIFGNF